MCFCMKTDSLLRWTRSANINEQQFIYLNLKVLDQLKAFARSEPGIGKL